MLNFFARLIPFIFLGMALVAFAFGLILFTYLLVLGAAIGVILFAINWVRERFFAPKQMVKTKKTTKDRGRTIDHDNS